MRCLMRTETLNVTIEQLADAFNEWMRRYTDEPERFQREWQTVNKFLASQSASREPSYGTQASEYLDVILVQMGHKQTCPCYEVSSPPTPPSLRTDVARNAEEVEA